MNTAVVFIKQQIPQNWVLPEKPKLQSNSRKSQHFMEPEEGSSLEPATRL
jgi:hypothetical protein